MLFFDKQILLHRGGMLRDTFIAHSRCMLVPLNAANSLFAPAVQNLLERGYIEKEEPQLHWVAALGLTTENLEPSKFSS